MLDSNKEKQQPKQSAELEYECRISDEQQWENIADEEFEVSSSYSPIDNYSPRFLKVS